MKAKNYDLDNLDLQILSILMDDSRVTYSQIGKALFVSPGTVHVRVQKLEQMGVIKRQQIVVDYEKLGYDVTAFIGIYLQKSSLYEEVVTELQAMHEVVSINYTTGNYSMFVKIICRDTNHLKLVLHDKIQHINGIQRTETFISLEERANRPVKLLDEEVKIGV
ncbi:MAG: Lrp/AsnC ligand binding domain-containing protein [Chitinophagales bacterium]|jgi:Lrp/AsnC family transcriptional regulator for asnA, asnC and gidA|nr:Lrp/AsnC ligand binding domain-containing protein [Chitinophagales bacterium]HNI45187.1 Lrp/AsnC ligand binding domain-containing protein [Chitinophagales bacterium]